MLDIRRILFPTDLSDESYHAFDAACSLAKYYQACLAIMHVAEEAAVASTHPDLSGEKLQLQLRRWQLDAGPIETETHLVRSDNALDSILTAATVLSVDLIVIGTYNRTGLRHSLFGSIVERVVRSAPCPVMTVKVSMPLVQVETSTQRVGFGWNIFKSRQPAAVCA